MLPVQSLDSPSFFPFARLGLQQGDKGWTNAGTKMMSKVLVRDFFGHASKFTYVAHLVQKRVASL